MGASRGLEEEQRVALRAAVEAVAEENVGMPLIYSCIEVAQERLTEYNRTGDCPICLEALNGDGGGDGSSCVVRTACYHRYHTSCLADYWASQVYSNFVNKLVTPKRQTHRPALAPSQHRLALL